MSLQADPQATLSSFTKAQCNGVTIVALNCYNIANATQGNSHNAPNLHKIQTIPMICSFSHLDTTFWWWWSWWWWWWWSWWWWWWWWWWLHKYRPDLHQYNPLKRPHEKLGNTPSNRQTIHTFTQFTLTHILIHSSLPHDKIANF